MKQHLRMIFVGMLIVMALVTSMLPWTARPAQASTDWKREYENSIGKKCPEDNLTGQDGYSYKWCQCTSYVAFRLARAGVKSSDFSYPGNGDAENWPTRARERNIRTGSEPQKGAVYTKGSHVMWVEDVINGNVLISDYNGIKTGNYDTRWLSSTEATGGTYIYFSNVGNSGGGSGAPSQPRGLQIKDIENKSAKIDWDSQSGVNYFCVNWSDKNATPNGCDVTVKGSDSSYKPTNLKADKTYYVWVQACNSSGVCSSAAKTSFKTKK